MKRGHSLAIQLGGRLQRLREERGLSQRQLAIKVGCSPMQVLRWEKGLTLPTADTLAGLAEALNVSSDTLLFDSADSGTHIRNPLVQEAVAALSDMSEHDLTAVLHIIRSMAGNGERGDEKAKAAALKRLEPVGRYLQEMSKARRKE